MSGPQYTLFRLCDPHASEATRKQVTDEFFRVPEACLSLFCKRVRFLCPNPAALTMEAPHITNALANGTRLSVDVCERLHAQMRQDLNSGGRARSATASSNRTFCQQVRAEHFRRSSMDPAKPLPITLPAACVDQSSALVAVNVPQVRLPRSGGNPRSMWQNSKLSVYKALHAPCRALTGDELSAFYEKCNTDWAKASEAEKKSWGMVWRAEVAAKKAKAALPSPAAAPKEFKPLWSSGGGPLGPVPLSSLVSQHKDTSSSDRRLRSLNDPALIVTSPPSVRCAARPCDHHNSDLHGCLAQKKNVCRHCLPVEAKIVLDAMCGRLNKWVDTLTAAIACQSRQLLCLSGQHGDTGARRDVLVSLIDCRFSPKMQYFSRFAVHNI